MVCVLAVHKQSLASSSNSDLGSVFLETVQEKVMHKKEAFIGVGLLHTI